MHQLIRPTKTAYSLAFKAIVTAFSCTVPETYVNAAIASERVYIDLLVHQLNALEETASRSAELSEKTEERYHFDYSLLMDDIARIRRGLKDYLSPHRAQPRDPVELSGSYTMEDRKP